MTTNIVTTKQKRNRELEGIYKFGTKAPMRAAPAAGAAPVAQPAADTRLKLLEKKDGKAKVRDDLGNEGWVDESALYAH